MSENLASHFKEKHGLRVFETRVWRAIFGCKGKEETKG
jgi:hypothetical protein